MDTAKINADNAAIERAIRMSEDGGELDNEFSARPCDHPDCDSPNSAGARYVCSVYVSTLACKVHEYVICDSCRESIITA